MITSILRYGYPGSAAVVAGLLLWAAYGGQPAHAQRVDPRVAPGAEIPDRRAAASCPCLTGKQVDTWFAALRQTVDPRLQQRLTGRQTKLLCVNEPGFMTFDYLKRTQPPYALYVDLSYKQGINDQKQARCVVEFSHQAGELERYQETITRTQAAACRQQLLRSRIWRQFGCPNNRRSRELVGQNRR